MGLLAVGIKLKVNYKSYSAVLVSGAMTIMYFITFAGYSFYELLPVSLAFGLMVLFTFFTVLAPLSYDMPVIALIVDAKAGDIVIMERTTACAGG